MVITGQLTVLIYLVIASAMTKLDVLTVEQDFLFPINFRLKRVMV